MTAKLSLTCIGISVPDKELGSVLIKPSSLNLMTDSIVTGAENRSEREEMVSGNAVFCPASHPFFPIQTARRYFRSDLWNIVQKRFCMSLSVDMKSGVGRTGEPGSENIATRFFKA